MTLEKVVVSGFNVVFCSSALHIVHLRVKWKMPITSELSLIPLTTALVQGYNKSQCLYDFVPF